MTTASGLVVEIGEPPAFRVGEQPITLRPKERSVIGALVVRHPEPVPTSELIELVWGAEPPRSARASVHNHLARIRELAPTLVTGTRAGYRIDTDVTVDVDADVPAVLTALGLSDGPSARRACASFVERWQVVNDGFPAAIRRGAVGAILARLERETIDDPTDERRAWRLMVAHAVEGRPAEVRAAYESLRRHLGEIGLEPSRRIADVVRLAEHEVREPAAYLADPFGGPIDRFVHRESRFRSDVETVRAAIVAERHSTIDVAGARDQRREVLRRVVDAVRLDGIDATIVSCTPQMVAAPDPVTDPDRDRPAVVVIDGIDHLADVDHATERVRLLMRPTDPSAVVVVRGRDATVDGDTASLELTPVEDDPMPVHDETGSRHDRSDSTLSEVVATLSVLDEPVAPAMLARLVEMDAIDRAMRIGIVHHDHANDRIVSRIPGDRRAADVSRRAELIDRVLGLDLGDSALAGGSRRLRLLVELLSITAVADRPGGDAEGVAEGVTGGDAGGDAGQVADGLRRTAIDLAEHATAEGSPLTAAVALRRAFTAIDERAETRHTSVWFDVAIRTGRAEHALAESAGPALLREVVFEAHSRGDDHRAADALLELARLGPVATAGSADADALELFELLDRADGIDGVDDPRGASVVARVGAAGAMILSFASDPERLRAVFDRAEAAARRSGDRELIEVLPHAFMSLPLPDDVGRRRTIADDLLAASDRLDDAAGRWEALHLAVAHAVMDGDPGFRRLTDETIAISAALPERSRRWEGAYLDANRALIDGDLEAARMASTRQLELAGNVHPDRVAAVYGAAELAIALAEGTEAALAPITAELAEDQPDVGAWHAALAACAASAGDASASRTAIDRCLDGGVLVLDHTYTAALLALGHAAVALDDRDAARRVFDRLDRYRGTWTWCGSTTFGPVDLTLSRLARMLDEPDARDLAVAAVTTTARMSAPLWNRHAIEEVLVGDD